MAIDKCDGDNVTPARNRVTPTGDIEAIALRGAWTGNRGILHCGHEIVRFHASDLWITCALEFRGRWHEQWQPHHYTFLYFHDEAVSFAAGHRPCAECRRDSYNAYRAAWAEGLGVDVPSAKMINRQLHGERIVRGTHRRRLHRLPWADLPDGAFVLLDTSPTIVIGDQLTKWTREGYRPRPLPRYAAATAVRTVILLRHGKSSWSGDSLAHPRAEASIWTRDVLLHLLLVVALVFGINLLPRVGPADLGGARLLREA